MRQQRVRHRVVLEGAHHVQQGVGVAQPGQLVGRDVGVGLALGRGGRRRQVDVGDVGRDLLPGLEELGQAREPLIGHLDHAGVDGEAAEAAGLGVALGE